MSFDGLTTGEKVLLVLVWLNLIFLAFDGIYIVLGAMLPVFGITIGV